MSEERAFFHACYRDSGLLPRSACDHSLYQLPFPAEDGRQFARIDKYLFGLTKKGLDMFRCFLDCPELLVTKYGWNSNVVEEIKQAADWTGERLSFEEAQKGMRQLADHVAEYEDGSILFIFSRNKVDFNLEVYSTPCLDFLEGFLIASIDSGNYRDYFSLIINELNIIEIECDYGLNPYPDDNPWKVLYDGLKLKIGEYEIYPSKADISNT